MWAEFRGCTEDLSLQTCEIQIPVVSKEATHVIFASWLRDLSERRPQRVLPLAGSSHGRKMLWVNSSVKAHMQNETKSPWRGHQTWSRLHPNYQGLLWKNPGSRWGRRWGQEGWRSPCTKLWVCLPHQNLTPVSVNIQDQLASSVHLRQKMHINKAIPLQLWVCWPILRWIGKIWSCVNAKKAIPINTQMPRELSKPPTCGCTEHRPSMLSVMNKGFAVVGVTWNQPCLLQTCSIWISKDPCCALSAPLSCRIGKQSD